MGFAKREMEEREHNRSLALQIALDARALRECDHHDGVYYDGSEDVEAARCLADSRIKSGELELPRGMSPEDFTDLIKEVYEENSASSSCWICEKNFEDD